MKIPGDTLLKKMPAELLSTEQIFTETSHLVSLALLFAMQSFKSIFLTCDFRNWLATITQFKNGRDTILILGQEQVRSNTYFSCRVTGVGFVCIRANPDVCVQPSHLSPCMSKWTRVEYLTSLTLKIVSRSFFGLSNGSKPITIGKSQL